MDLLKTNKEELMAEKATVESKIAALATKAGAEAFIAEEKANIPVITTPRVSSALDHMTMDEFLQCHAACLERYPEAVVAREIQQLEKQSIEIGFEIGVEAGKEIAVKEKPLGEVKVGQ